MIVSWKCRHDHSLQQPYPARFIFLFPPQLSPIDATEYHEASSSPIGFLYAATFREKNAILVHRFESYMNSFGPYGVANTRGGNVANIRFALLTMALAFTLFRVQATAQALRDPQPDFAPTFVGRTLTCSEPQKLLISRPFMERAKVKARLYNLLRESLYDDAKGIVNIELEREIKNLASKLKSEKVR